MAPKILVGADAKEVSEHLADQISSAISANNSSVIGLSGGSLPKFFVQAITSEKLKSVDWSKITFIFCDERLVDFESPDSTFKLYQDALIGKVEGITEKSFVLIDPKLNAEEAAKDYVGKLLKLDSVSNQNGFPSYDLLLLGMGPDGHTCSLFPGHALLDEKSLIVAPITDSPKPPPSR